MRVKGRSAIVTGGAGGLATVRRLVDAGMRVVVFDHAVEGARALVDELSQDAVAVGGDVNADERVAAAVDAARSLGMLSVLVNVAGGVVGGGSTVASDGTPHDKASFADWPFWSDTRSFAFGLSQWDNYPLHQW